MVWPDRTPHPGLQEFRYLARPARVTAVDPAQGKFQVENRRYFADLSDLHGEWALKVEGQVAQSGELTELQHAASGSHRLHPPAVVARGPRGVRRASAS